MAIRKVGACRILGELGKGGMAKVYRAVHEPLQREVAIKELPPETAKNAEAMSRFRREAMALAGFRHQNIVTLYDFIEKNDSYYMVMELVDGPTLHELIKEGPLPPEVVAVVGEQLAAALEHAHFARIIHRDLKPANVMLTKAGEVKLMDFGIAQNETLDALTKTGMAVGTPVYMSPEQVGGEDVDHRSDIYSLGVLLYECLSGQRPFTGHNAGEVFARIREGKPKPLKKLADVPAPLRAIVARAMQVKKEKRYFDVSEMRRALDAWLSANVTLSPPALLLAFLHQKKRISESEVLARLTQTEFAWAEKLDRPASERLPRSRGWLWALVAVVLGAAGGTWVASRAAPDWLPAWFPGVTESKPTTQTP